MQVDWNRTSTGNEVSCTSAGNAAVLLCNDKKLLRIEHKGQRTIYVFQYGTFQHFPRYKDEFKQIKRSIPTKQYFDTYRQLLDGNQHKLINNESAIGAAA